MLPFTPAVTSLTWRAFTCQHMGVTGSGPLQIKEKSLEREMFLGPHTQSVPEWVLNSRTSRESR